MQKTRDSKTQILIQKFNLKFQLTSKNQKFKKDKSNPVKEMGNIELPSKLKKLEKPHEQEILQLYSLIVKMNTEIQALKVENQNLKFLLQDKKKEDKGQVSQVQFQIETLTSKFVLIENNLNTNLQKLKVEVQLLILKNQPEADNGN